MKAAKTRKATIDWYFPRVHGRVVVAHPKPAKKTGVVGTAHVEKENVEARHRSAWRSQPRRFFGMLVAGIIFFQPSLFAAEPTLSSVAKDKAGQKAKAKADIAAKAKKTYPKEAKKTEKSVSGTVVSVRKSGISLELGQSEENGAEEMLISLGEDLKFSNARSAKDLQYGDLVEVKFVQIYLPAKLEGENPSVLDTRALEIRLVQKAADRVAAAPSMPGVPA